MRKILFAVCMFCFFQSLSAQELNLFEKKEFINGKDTLRYRILYPPKYKKRKSYPLIVFLHGSGERGRDNEAQLIHGGNLFVKEIIRKNFPAIVVFPQCPADSTWSRFKRVGNSVEREFLRDEMPPVPQQLVKQLIDSLVINRIADDRRLYLGGLSLGGFGVYDLLTRYPDYFAAAFPICGAANIPLFLEKATRVPLWIFHGAMDNTVSPKEDRELFKAMLTRGIKSVQYTEYPKAGHNSWDSAFAEPKLLPWLFTNKKKRKDLQPLYLN
ncbi:MAG: PHB depolymerase family esterase [Bacteroidota bacterium]